jgi:hypothetical protein
MRWVARVHVVVDAFLEDNNNRGSKLPAVACRRRHLHAR